MEIIYLQRTIQLFLYPYPQICVLEKTHTLNETPTPFLSYFHQPFTVVLCELAKPVLELSKCFSNCVDNQNAFHFVLVDGDVFYYLTK